MMKCLKCNCDLSPQEKDDILSDICEGIKPTAICEDCRDDIMYAEEEDDEDYDTLDENGY